MIFDPDMLYHTLRNNIKIPYVGFGTWQVINPELMKKLIAGAYNEGYRLVDTAAAYSNEIALAKAVAAAGIRRDDLFLSDKAWNTSRGYTAVQEACRRSLKKLKTDHLDLYMIHWPASKKLYPDWAEINADTWRGMEQLYKDGYVKAIGVCNFKEHHLDELAKTAVIMPMVDQFEMHPGLPQENLVKYCAEHSILAQASSPLGNGQILSNSQIGQLVQKKEKTPAQICLRWEIQKGVIVIPKTSNLARLAENIDIFDFSLDEEEMLQIDSMPYCGGLGIDPDEVTEFG